MICFVNYRIKLIKLILFIALYTDFSLSIINVKKTSNHPITINARINWGENSIFSSNVLLDANESDTLGTIKKRITNITGIPLLSQRIYLINNGNIDYDFGPINSNMTLKTICSNQIKVSNTVLKPHIELHLDIAAPYLPVNKLINTTNLDNVSQSDIEQLDKLYEQLAELLASQYKINKLLDRTIHIKMNWSSYKNLSLDQLSDIICFGDFKTHHSNLNDYVTNKDKMLTIIKPETEVEVEIDEIEPLELNLFQDYPRESYNIITKIAESIKLNLPISFPALLKFTIISQLLRITGNYPPKVNFLLKISPLIMLLSHTRQGSIGTKIFLKLIPFKYFPRGNLISFSIVECISSAYNQIYNVIV